MAILSAIDVGSHSIKMKIVEYTDSEIIVLEDLTKAIRLGIDSFNIQKIQLETINEAVECLNYFKHLMNEYNVDHYMAVATSAVREAENSRYVIDFINRRTGLNVEIIDDSIEKFMTYKSIRDFVDDYKSVRMDGSLLIEVNSGSCDISVYHKNKLVRNDEILIGVLRLKSILQELETRTEGYTKILEDYVYAITENVHKYIKNKSLKNYMVIGGKIKDLKTILGFKNNAMSKVEFEDMYSNILKKDSTFKQKVLEFNLDWSEIISSIIIFKVFFELVDTDVIMIPNVSLRDGMIAELIDLHYDFKKYKDFNNDILHHTRSIAKRYKSSVVHGKAVERSAVMIFDQVDHLNNLTKRDRLLLQCASILHEIGKYTRIKDYTLTSYDKIRNLNIFGMTYQEMDIIANIVRYSSSKIPSDSDDNYARLSDFDKVKVAKLSSILSIADSLDKSKKAKVKVNDVVCNGYNVIVDYEKVGDITLEEWSFETASDYFVSTFGMKIIIKEV